MPNPRCAFCGIPLLCKGLRHPYAQASPGMCIGLHPQWKQLGIGGNEVASSGTAVSEEVWRTCQFSGELQKDIKSETCSAVCCSELAFGKTKLRVNAQDHQCDVVRAATVESNVYKFRTSVRRSVRPNHVGQRLF